MKLRFTTIALLSAFALPVLASGDYPLHELAEKYKWHWDAEEQLQERHENQERYEHRERHDKYDDREEYRTQNQGSYKANEAEVENDTNGLGW